MSKAFAYETESEFITLEHLVKAINSFNVTNDALKEVMVGHEEIVLVEDVEEKIATAKTLAVKSFDTECLESAQYKWLKEHMEQTIGEFKS